MIKNFVQVKENNELERCLDGYKILIDGQCRMIKNLKKEEHNLSENNSLLNSKLNLNEGAINSLVNNK